VDTTWVGVKEVSVLDKREPGATGDAQERLGDDGAPRRRRRMILARVDRAAPTLSIAVSWDALR
jgi:hypothetical protein